MARRSFRIGAWLVWIMLLSCSAATTNANVCTDGDSLGDILDDFPNHDNRAGREFLFADSSSPQARSIGEIGCYGTVKGFQIRCRPGASGGIEFTVWRTDSAPYTPLGSYTHEFTCDTVDYTTAETAAVHPWDQIPVRPGDRIGFKQLNDGGVVAMENPSAGACCDVLTINNPSGTWSDPETKRIALRAVLGPSVPPQFDNLPNTVHISEDVLMDGFVYDVRASDKNAVRWGTSEGEIVDFQMSHSHFKIDQTNGQITTTQTLDFETQSVHYLPVIIRDVAPHGGQSVTSTLTVSLVDVEEHLQIVNLPNATLVDALLSPAGTEVFRVAVNQPSSTDVNYVIEAHVPPDDAFVINSDGGVLASRDVTDMASPYYVLRISANDGSFRTGSFQLSINITNLKMAPVLDNLPGSSLVPEDAIHAAVVFQVLATDADGDSLTFTIDSISPSSGLNKFYINNNTGEVWLVENAGLDHETVASYQLEIVAHDYLFDSLPASLTIIIANVNEPPMFHPNIYHEVIPEKQSNGTLLALKFSASDEDPGDQLTYSILTGSGSDFFIINGERLEIEKRIDLGLTELTVNFVFTVLVTDANGLTDVATVNITVYNVNDPHKVINLPDTITLDARTVISDTEIFKVEVDPSTIEVFDVFTYTMVDLPAPNDGLIYLNPVTGVVTVSKELRDHPTASYTLPITVHDRQGQSHGPLDLVVDIVNIRQPPVIDNLPRTVHLPENARDQVDLFQILASDPDLDPIVTFNLLSTLPLTDQLIFDTMTGSLRTVVDPEFDHEVVSSYTLEFSVSDDLHESDPAYLTLDIDDVNEMPVFNTRYFTAVIDEEEPVDTPVTLLPSNLDATDPDGNTIEYILNPGPSSDYFSVTPGGVIKMKQRIDRDNGVPYSMMLEVVAQDPSGLRDKATVEITVVDINDNVPTFLSPYYSATIRETAKGGTSVVTVVANDLDPSPNGDITYRIEGDYVTNNSSLGDLFFQVHYQSGLITVKHEVNFEDYRVVSFHVIAEDAGLKQSTTNVTITILDVNEHRPTFIREFYNLEVASYIDVGSHVATLYATDDDSGARGTVQYHFLLADNNHYFSLHEDSGRILTDQPLVKDTKYVLYSYAEDRADTVNEVQETSTTAIVRVDAYDARKYVISIYMSLSVNEFELQRDIFLQEMNVLLTPWVIKIESVEAIGDQPTSTNQRRRRRRKRHPHTTDSSGNVEAAGEFRSRVNIYALHDSLTDSVANLELPKSFVHRDDILPKLRTSIFGNPRDILTTGTLEQFHITEVQPKHPIWAIDTLEGILTLTFSALLFVILVVTLVVLCCRWKRLCCFAGSRGQVKRPKEKHAKVAKNNQNHRQQPVKSATSPLPPVEAEEDFKLNYRPHQPSDKRMTSPPLVRAEDVTIMNAKFPTDQKNIASRPNSSSTIHSNIYPSLPKETNVQRQNWLDHWK